MQTEEEFQTSCRLLEERATQDWYWLAQEPVTVEVKSSSIYAFGSELACLRLFHAFRDCKDIRCAYSKNRQSFYFSKPKGF